MEVVIIRVSELSWVERKKKGKGGLWMEDGNGGGPWRQGKLK